MYKDIMKYKYYNEDITQLKPNQIFVFGSNLAGKHGAGAAKLAMNKFGAKYGIGIGLTGQCYAIPTKDHQIESLPLELIEQYVFFFKQFASINHNTEFLVSRVGCGLAGYTDEQIAPMFRGSTENCVFDEKWRKYLE